MKYFIKAIPTTFCTILVSFFIGAPFLIWQGIEYIYSQITKQADIPSPLIASTLILFAIIINCCWAISLAMEATDAKNMEDAEANQRERAKLESERAALYKEINSAQHDLDVKNDYLDEKETDVNELIHSTSQECPWLAKLYSEYMYIDDMRIVRYLKRKKRPALKSSEEVAKIAKEKRDILKQSKQYEYQVNFYETLFPWLEEFKEVPPTEAYEMTLGTSGNDEYAHVRQWLSPEEYNSLPSYEKWQRALDNYMNRPNKTNWHIGIEYERYVGYVYESNGYKVTYEGALKGLDDRGRDIIAKNKNETLVIQCKRWAKEKTIHEKHIMQLFGSVTVLNMESKTKARGVFITTTTLSDIAAYFAEQLGIEVLESYEFKPYPIIKCNISSSGEKIYHLPFDQQYDKIRINGKNNFYVETVKEAEDKGFRHAYRWRGSSSEEQLSML
ncbi:restriction endonuclease [Clostridiales bacterium]|nr:restriction endonuclease [Clostridiales bacterium]